MKKLAMSTKIESLLFMRNFFGFFFTFVFPLIMLFLFGSIYGNEPSAFYGGYGAMDISAPSYSGMIVGVTGLMCFPLSLAEYKELGVYKRFDATPAGKGIIMMSQLIVNFFMTVVGIALLLIAGKLVYNIKIEGNIAIIIAGILLAVAAIFSLGFFITAIARDAKISNVLCYTIYFVMLFASGATLPSEMFPEGVRIFSKFLPLTHVVDLFKATFRGSPFSSYRVNVLVLVLTATVFGGLGAWFYKRKRWNG